MNEGPDASVLVGLVNQGPGIEVLLEALSGQTGSVSFEVIVASRLQEGTNQRVAGLHPDVTLLEAEPGTTLPELRTRAFEQAQGRAILVTEDHTVPPADWVAGLVRALDQAPEAVAAVGGPVANGRRARVLDRASFLCEYSAYLPPQEGGETHDLPGMNIAYRREVLEGIDREDLARGFWEATVHPRLRGQGRTLLRLPDVILEHRKSFGFREYASQRIHYSRWFAGTRFPRGAVLRRALYVLLSALLPVWILGRVSRQVWSRPSYRGELWTAWPAMACFTLCWGLGEAIGYLCGPGRSLSRID